MDASTGRDGGPIVYLHIGEPKTGTTFLQEIMWANRDQLARAGVLLPGSRVQDQFRATQDLRGVRQPASDPAASWQGEWDILARQAVRADRVAIISHELLVGASAKQAARAIASLQPAQVHVVVTVRDFASLLPAEWQETVKHRNTVDWDTWLREIIDRETPVFARRQRWFWTAHDTVALLQRWTAGLPAEHVHVITMPQRGAPPNLLWERFAGVIGVDPDAVDTGAARPNASLGLPEVELLRRLNLKLGRSLPHWFYAINVKGALAHEALAGRPKSGRLELPPDRRAWAHEQSRAVIAGLQAAGYDVVGDLDELRPQDSSGSGSRQPDSVTDAEMLDAAIDVLVALLQKDYAVRSAPPVRSSMAGSQTGRARELRRRLRILSTRYPAVGRARVAARKAIERSRTRRAGS